MRRNVIFSLLVLLLVLSPSYGHSQLARSGQIFLVNTTADGHDAAPGDGVCATQLGECTLRAAVMETNELSGSDTIHLPAGVYRITQFLPVEEQDPGVSDFDIRGTLTILGSGTSSTIVQGRADTRIFHILLNSDVTLSGMTIRDGHPYPVGRPEGGGIYSDDATLRLYDVVLANNQASGAGGALYAINGSLTISNTQVISNTSFSDAGGGFYLSNTTFQAFSSTFSLNRRGAALVVDRGTALVSSTTISQNQADFGGAGIFNDSSMTIINSTISGNVAGKGRFTFQAPGGGIYNDAGATLQLVNSTIAGNDSTLPGADLYNDPTGTVRLTNTIIASSTPDRSCAGAAPISEGHNLDSGGSCGLGSPSDMSNTDPRLSPLAVNGGALPTHALLPGSPAIDAAASDRCPATDQRGVARPYGAQCDIGAVEALPWDGGPKIYLPLQAR